MIIGFTITYEIACLFLEHQFHSTAFINFIVS